MKNVSTDREGVRNGGREWGVLKEEHFEIGKFLVEDIERFFSYPHDTNKYLNLVKMIR